MNIMNQVKRSGVVTRKQFIMLAGLLKSNRTKSFDPVVGTRKMLDTKLVTMAQMLAT